jgi:hypothetical protein
MPYTNPSQATAVFLSIKKKQGLAAAKAFGRKHRKELSSEAKGRQHKAKPYVARRQRGK